MPLQRKELSFALSDVYLSRIDDFNSKRSSYETRACKTRLKMKFDLLLRKPNTQRGFDERWVINLSSK